MAHTPASSERDALSTHCALAGLIALLTACSQGQSTADADGSLPDSVVDNGAEDTAPDDVPQSDDSVADTAADDGSGDDVPQPDDAVADTTADDGSGDDAAGEDATADDGSAAEVDSDVVDDADAPDDVAADDTDAPTPIVDELRVLFVGNSYIYTNDLPQTYRTLALEAGVGATSLVIDSVTAGGYRLEQHAADAAGSARLATLLAAVESPSPRWTHVVLQEQSQIPGFPLSVGERARSMTAVVELAARVDATDAQTVLLETWGYRNGDARNGALFADYPTMQARLTLGYREMFDAVAAAAYDVHLAPVGSTYSSVFAADSAIGDALAAGTLFTSLYSGDNSHPAMPGTYLAACVLLAHTADVDVRTLDVAAFGLAASTRDALQDAAMSTVVAD